VAEKEVLREIEATATAAHFARLRGTAGADASALNLDLLRELKRVNSYLVAAAYPVLEAQGELLPSRLRAESEGTIGAESDGTVGEE
jgi:phosphate:Na+ symporter